MKLSDFLVEILDEKRESIKFYENSIVIAKDKIESYEKDIAILSKQCLDLSRLITKQMEIEMEEF